MSNQKRMSSNLSDDLRTLLIAGEVTTQEDICAMLDKLGHSVNQSKISRLLRKLGAVKSKNEQGQIVYRLPKEPAPPTVNAQLSSLVIELRANESTIVINTSPGSAQLIARILDYNKTRTHILGTIAGDDTIFVIPTSIKKIKATIAEIKTLLF